MDIYLDVLFLENIVMNYLILVMTARFSKNKVSSLRLFLGALIGASYVVVMVLLPGMKVYYTAFAKIVLSVVIVVVAFTPEKAVSLIKTLAIFYVATFLFAGAAFALVYFDQSGGFVRNGIVYVFWKSKWTVLLLSILLVCIITRIFWEMIQIKIAKDKLRVRLKIVFGDRVTGMDALIDTGNSLHDPITNVPVVVVEYTAVKDILPQDIQRIFEESRENDLSSVTGIISASSWFSRFRLIPFTSLGKDNGMLLGFRPDYILIEAEHEEKGICDVIVGIYNRSLSRSRDYRALLGPELI